MLVPPIVPPGGTQKHQATRIDVKLPKLSVIPALIASVLVILFVLYFVLPVLSLRFVGWIVPLGFCVLPFMLISKWQKFVMIFMFALGAWLVLVPFFSTGIFHAKSYRALIGKVESTNFTELVSPVNPDQVPIIDRTFAASLAEKKLGEDFALGSRVTLGYPTIQMVDKRLFWVVPLLHSGFFKWLANINEGTPGYIKVSATNPQDITFVRELNGKPIKIKYQKSSCFNQDLYRHLYMNGFSGVGLAGDTFEIDDMGEPYWTITTYTHKIGVKGSEATGLATIHAGTGEIKYYPLIKTADGFSDANIPSWVDRVQPAYFVMPQLSWWGKYVRGFWNTLFGKRDMLMVTDGYNVIFGRDQRSYIYTGLSSVGSDEGTVGFTLIDTRNKSTHLYLVSGATEYAAMKSAEGKVQNFKYYATFPILVNMNGNATYFMTLKDSAGLVKMFCFVSVKDFSLVGVGESVKAARDNFQMAMAGSRIGTLQEGSIEKETLEGTVARFGSDIKDGRTFYYFSLTEKPGKIYIATSNLSSYLPLTSIGDRIKVSFMRNTDSEISLTELKNLSLGEK
ncbi:MAG: hypothetical protein CVU50_01675 [Candidatus Cloacimonetes bacterium HGW-Cloacimonetes-3]|jgi:hypothetical protein|nr:MAG: hypothetical protein CVU50_01675 [Candidatus Cloacimonetes bacterium HGW-Cloacimonetes-3]